MRTIFWHNLWLKNDKSFPKKFIVNDKTTSGMHTHDFTEVFWVTDGIGIHMINGKTYEIKSGDLWLIDSKDKHAVLPAANSDVAITNVAFAPNELNKMKSRWKDSPILLWDNLFKERVFKLSKDELAAMESIANSLIYNAKDSFNTDRFILNMLHIISKPASQINMSSMPDWLKHACEEIEKEENLKDGLGKFVKLSGRCSAHFSRAFKNHTGMTPRDYVTKLRIEKTLKEIEFSNQPIDSIAYDAGFNNLSHFHHIFKKMMGISPLKYRKLHGKNIF